MSTQVQAESSRVQRLSVRGEELLAKVRELIHQGNVRRIIVKAEGGEPIMEIPLTAGVIGAVVAPVLVAIGAIAALAKHYTIVIEMTEARRVRLASERMRRKRAPARAR